MSAGDHCPRPTSARQPTIERTWWWRKLRAAASMRTSSPSRVDLEPVERLDRAVRLAMDRAEGGEVVASDEMRRALGHRLDIERHRDVPDPAALERRRRAAVEDPIEVAPADAREARVPVVGDRLDLEDRDRVRAGPAHSALRAAGAG